MERYRLLLVEDEDIIRHGLRHMIEKLDLGFEILEAGDGTEALEICAATSVDVLLTDIIMPGMDGLSLVRMIRERGWEILCIIISGYREFEYAQEAIRYHVRDYLLKPVERNNLREVLERIRITLEETRKADQSEHDEAGRKQRSYWFDLLNDENHDSPEQGHDLYAPDWENDSFFLLGMYLPQGRLYEDILRTERRYGAAVAEVSTSGGYSFHVVSVRKESGQEFADAYSALKDDSSQMCSVLGCACHSAPEIRRSYRQCVNTLNHRLICGPWSVRLAAPAVPGNIEVPAHYLNAVRDTFLNKDLQRASDALHTLFSFLLANSSVTPELLIEVLRSLEIYMLNNTQEQIIRVASGQGRLRSLDYLMGSSSSMKEFEEAVFLRLNSISAGLKPGSESNSPIGIVLDYMEKHYNKEISAVYCSNLISMNTSYFSTYFKKKTGLSFVSYLQQLRLRKSVEMLKNPELRIYEIAEKNGFRDEKYFFKVFKQHYGITPSEFRTQLISDPSIH